MRLKELREEKNLSQLDIANSINTSRTNIGRWEKGINEPSSSALISLANFFECSVDYLLGREDDFGNITVQGTAPHLSAEETEIIQVYRKLPADLQRRATAHMRNLGALIDEESATKERKTI